MSQLALQLYDLDIYAVHIVMLGVYITTGYTEKTLN